MALQVHLSGRTMANGSDAALELAIKEVGWEETGKANIADVRWVVWYSDAESRQYPPLVPGQIVNRFPAMADCCRKALFAGLFARLRRLMPADDPLNDPTLLPLQWALPRQNAELSAHVERGLQAARASGEAPPIFIVKPDAGSKGDGIELTPEPCRNTRTSAYDRGKVVQQYIEPLLLDGLKFDLRLYVLLTSAGGLGDPGPMQCFLCREGLVRFAVDKYDSAGLDNMHAHLTNFAINKRSGGFVRNDAADGGRDGSKRTVSSVFAALHEAGLIADVEGLWEEIGELTRRALGVVQPVLASARDAWAECPAFSVLGLDVLLDRSARPWLIELNVHPSLRIDDSCDGPYSEEVRSPVDEAVKVPMLADALRIVADVHGLPCLQRDTPREPPPSSHRLPNPLSARSPQQQPAPPSTPAFPSPEASPTLVPPAGRPSCSTHAFDPFGLQRLFTALADTPEHDDRASDEQAVPKSSTGAEDGRASDEGAADGDEGAADGFLAARAAEVTAEATSPPRALSPGSKAVCTSLPTSLPGSLMSPAGRLPPKHVLNTCYVEMHWREGEAPHFGLFERIRQIFVWHAPPPSAAKEATVWPAASRRAHDAMTLPVRAASGG